ncbi:hypothetical protein LTR62_007613 [Meristemomyces frigidus]|uniref:Uncharacterized protein n=1 Tax=Meristemomyces frigidus TaxID=1508187 RepID=A0AAN7TAF7_9PEZI|nr:hypothetical protein LTR62_007613 [Meristemomyces frigidus]
MGAAEDRYTYGDALMADLDENELEDATPSEVADQWLNEHNSNGSFPSRSEQSDDDNVQSSSGQSSSMEEALQNYFSENPLLSELVPPAPSPTDGHLDIGLEPNYSINAIRSLMNRIEVWDVGKETTACLASVVILGKDEGSLGINEATIRLRDLKQPAAILLCDPDLELQDLKLRNAVFTSWHDLGIPVWEQDDGDDIDRHFRNPRSLEQVKTNLNEERIEITKAEAIFLHDIVFTSGEISMTGIQAEIESRRMIKSVSPTLLPLSPPYSPPPVEASLLEFELTSTPENLMAVEALDVAKRLEAQDEQHDHSSTHVLQSEQLSDFRPPYSPFRTSSIFPSSPTSRKLQSKVELPLTPRNGSDSSSALASGNGRLPDIGSLLPLPDSDVSALDSQNAERHLRDFVKDAARPFADIVTARLEDEELSAVDTIMRVPVPAINTAPPAPPWAMPEDTKTTQGRLAAARANLPPIIEEVIENYGRWGGVSKLERSMTWSAFPVRLGKTKVNEDLDDDDSAAKYLASIAFDDKFDIQALIARTEHLKILDDHDSDDDDLETESLEGYDIEKLDDEQHQRRLHLEANLTKVTALLATPKIDRMTAVPASNDIQPLKSDMQSLLRKRKLQLEESSLKIAKITGASEGEATTATIVHNPRTTAGPPSRVGELLGAGDLSYFMKLQGGTRVPSPPAKTTGTVTQVSVPAAVMVVPEVLEPVPMPVIPLPQLQNLKSPIQVIFSTKLFANRVLIRSLQSQLPMLEMIERSNLLATECDIVLSLGTALILTTLQKMKQKPLPGQHDHFGLRERVTGLSSRYETVIVLVSEGKDGLTHSNEMDDRDCSAVTEFMAFGSSLATMVEVYFVPGGMAELYRWLAAIISQRAGVEGVKLLQDETQWERFLRVVGLDAFAAQAVLGRVNQLGLSPDAHGLGLLLQMSEEQRMRLLGQWMGGDMNASRVEEAAGGPWSMSPPVALK